jgi:hypothetical protein
MLKKIMADELDELSLTTETEEALIGYMFYK